MDELETAWLIPPPVLSELPMELMLSEELEEVGDVDGEI